jgi:hypothetical protein
MSLPGLETLVITFINFDGSNVGSLPAGFANTSMVPGHPGNYKVGNAGAISSPNSLYDASGNTEGSALWTNFLAADQAIQFDQIVSLSGGVMSPLIRMSSNGKTGYGALISWSGLSVKFVLINPNGAIATLASPAIPAYPNGAQVTVKLQIQGTTLSFKSWVTGTAEPASWTATTTDSTYSAAGYGGFSNGGGAVDNVYFGPPGTTFTGGFIAPTLSTGTIAWNSAQLQWTAASQSAGTVSYQLMRSPHGTNSFTAVNGATSSPATDSTVEAVTAYDYKVTASDGINAPVNSNAVTLTTASAPTATAFTVNGPSWGMVNTTSFNFSVAPNGKFTGQITITPTGGGLSTPIVLTFANSSNPQTFSIDPSAVGTVTLAATNSGSLTNPSSLSYDSTQFNLFIPGSGQSVILVNDTTISGLADGNDRQTIALNGLVSGGEFTLTFNGQTTGVIHSTETDPTSYGLYTIPVTPGTPYLIATNLTLLFGAAPNTLVQIMDGNLLVSSEVINQVGGTPDYTTTDTTSAHPGDTLYMKNLNGGVSITPTTSTLKIYFTPASLNYQYLICDLVTLTNQSTGTVLYCDDSDSTYFSGPGFTQYQHIAYNNEVVASQSPTPGGLLFSLSASDVQAALESLSTIGAGGVSVSGSNPCLIEFIGSLAGQSQSLITCSDPVVAVTHTSIGGSPAITITPEGGSPGSPIQISSGNIVWGSGVGMGSGGSNISPYANYAMMLLPQSAPDHLYYSFGAGVTLHYSDLNNFYQLGGSTYGDVGYIQSTGGGDAIYQQFMQGLPPATYQIAMTWPASDSLSTDVPVTITDGTSGATLSSVTVNQSIAPGAGDGDFLQDGFYWRVVTTVTTASPSTGIVFTIEGSSGIAVAFDTALVTRTSPDLSVKILPTDTVTFTLPNRFVSNSSAAFSGVIPNLSGGSSFQAGGFGVVPSSPVTMDVGYDVGGDASYMPVLQFSDLVERIYFGGVVTYDANGYPTLLNAQSPNLDGGAVLPNWDEFGLGTLQPSAPYGLWTIQWTANGGEDLLGLYPLYNVFTEVMEYQNLTGPIKQRVFNVQPDPTTLSRAAPYIQPTITAGSSADENGNYPFSANNFHIYPPDPADPTGMTAWGLLGSEAPPRFHPNFVAQLAGARCLRFIDWLGINAPGVTAEFTDFRQPNLVGSVVRTYTGTAVSVTNYTGTPLFDPADCPIFEITTSSPHGVFNLCTVLYTPPEDIQFSNGQVFSAGTLIGGTASPVSATVFQWRVPSFDYNPNNPANVTMTNTVTGGTFTWSTSSPNSVQDCVALCNQVGADFWAQCPISMTDSGMTDYANYVATNLNPGLKVIGEFGNELWNYALGNAQVCAFLSYQEGAGNDSSSSVGQCVRGAVWHDALMTAFTAVGRGSDVIRGIGVQGSNPDDSTIIAQTCQRRGITFDAVLSAPYFTPAHIIGTEPTFQAAYDLMTPYGTPQKSDNVDQTGGQATDWYELMMIYSEQPSVYVAGHRTALDNAGLPDVKIFCYEGGPDEMTPSYSPINASYRSHIVLWHPRARNWMMAALEQLQNAGCTRFMRFQSSGGNGPNGNFPFIIYDQWATYRSWNMIPGTGTEPGVSNARNPEQLDQLVSVVGGAMNEWNSLAPSLTTTGGSKKCYFMQIGTVGARTHGAGASTRGERHF